MPIERWECEYCGETFDSEWECEAHEDDCDDNPDNPLRVLLASKCATCSQREERGHWNYYAPECKLKHKKLPVSECDMYCPSDEIPAMLSFHNINVAVEDFKQMLTQ